MGKHSKVSPTAKRIAALASGLAIPAAIVSTPAVASAAELPPAAIAECESSGNIRAQNPSSSASGKWQFINSTWLAYGGGKYAPRAYLATEAEQDAVAAKLYAAEGTSPWNASKSCWGGKSSASAGTAVEPSEKPAKASKATVKAADVDEAPTVSIETYQALPVVTPKGGYTPGGTGTYEVQAGDTLTHLAVSNGTTVDAIVEKNSSVIEHEDWIYVGEKLTLK